VREEAGEDGVERIQEGRNVRRSEITPGTLWMWNDVNALRFAVSREFAGAEKDTTSFWSIEPDGNITACWDSRDDDPTIRLAPHGTIPPEKMLLKIHEYTQWVDGNAKVPLKPSQHTTYVSPCCGVQNGFPHAPLCPVGIDLRWQDDCKRRALGLPVPMGAEVRHWREMQKRQRDESNRQGDANTLAFIEGVLIPEKKLQQKDDVYLRLTGKPEVKKEIDCIPVSFGLNTPYREVSIQQLPPIAVSKEIQVSKMWLETVNGATYRTMTAGQAIRLSARSNNGDFEVYTHRRRPSSPAAPTHVPKRSRLQPGHSGRMERPDHPRRHVRVQDARRRHLSEGDARQRHDGVLDAMPEER
jgi:hypothetical protein